jgi:hypothetical protein
MRRRFGYTVRCCSGSGRAGASLCKPESSPGAFAHSFAKSFADSPTDANPNTGASTNSNTACANPDADSECLSRFVLGNCSVLRAE